MELLESGYRYDPSALAGGLTSNEMVWALVLCVILGVLYLFLPKISQKFDTWKALRTREKNRNIIHDLRMMKEIQSEIDDEMRRAILAKALLEKGLEK